VGHGLSANWSGKNLTAIVSKGWIGAGTSHAPPDLNSLDFPAPATNDTVGYEVSAFYNNEPLGAFLSALNFWKPLATRQIYLRPGSEEGSHAPL